MPSLQQPHPEAPAPSRRPAADPKIPRWLTQREVATLLAYSPRQVRRLIVAGLFPEPIRVLGPTSHPRWLATTVEAWMTAQRRRTGA